jgi:putative endonuclease
MNSKQLGNLGEKVAENYLKNKGYKILDRNYEFRIFGGPQKGEIDIIAKKNDIISFIEVKTLHWAQGKSFLPEDKVDFQKQRKLVKTAESWLLKKKIPLDAQWQIDIIAVEISQNNKAKIRHLENAVY